MSRRWTVGLSPTLLAAAEARRFLEPHLEGLSRPAIDDVLLMASELVSNAVRHGAEPLDVAVELTGPREVRVVVTNAGRPRTVIRTRPAASTAEGGRGLLIVDALARAWGVDGVDGPPPSTRAWFDYSAEGPA